MKLPNVSNNLAVIALAAGIAIVTWVVVVTAKAPNPAKECAPAVDLDCPSKPAAQAATPAAPAKPEPNVTYVRTDFDKSVKPDAPPPTP